MKDDPRQILSDQLIASELKRKEKQLAEIKKLPFGLGFYATAGLLLVSIVYSLVNSGLAGEGVDVHMVMMFVMASLLVLLDILSNIRSHQKINALLELIGEENLRKLTKDSTEIDPDEY